MSINMKKGQKNAKINPLEAIRDISSSTAQTMKQEVGAISSDFMDQLFGIKNPNFSGEIYAGETVEIKPGTSSEKSEALKMKKQAEMERALMNEEMEQNERKINELKMQLKAIQNELLLIVSQTQQLAAETEKAAMEVPTNPGLYHVIFFEKLLDFVRTFRKKIEEANEWLSSVNKRASKKNMWGQNYKKHGASYLLSGEHYLARSAG